MKYLSISIIYVAFFGVIGFATYYTNNANCLWALLLMPEWKSIQDDKPALNKIYANNINNYIK
jgi:hypothetical protein